MFALIAVGSATGAFAGAKEDLPAMIRVDGGIVAFGDEELYVPAFFITVAAVAEENGAGGDCQPPTVGEYLLAAQHPDFKVSRTFAFLQAPPEDACSWSREVLAAEGVEGNIYFAGIGNHVPAELTFVAGGTEPGNSIARIHANIWHFWGDEYKPAPRSRRCVRHAAQTFPKATVRRFVEVKSRRDPASRTKMTLAQGTEITVIHTSDHWRFIQARGVHGCQPDPEWSLFEDTGWIAGVP